MNLSNTNNFNSFVNEYNHNINFTMTDNYEPDQVGWIIDRTPDYNIINSIQINQPVYEAYLRDRYFEYQFSQITEALNNGTIQFQPNDEEFIPFDPEPQPPPIIQINVNQFPVLEEDKNCCVCMEFKETSQICNLNCNHKFCGQCISTHIRRNIQEPCCPLCRNNITNISVQNDNIRQIFI